MDIEIIREKQRFYENKIEELKNANISDLVAERLELISKEIEKEIINNISEDIAKCQHYLEVLDELIADNEADHLATIESEENCEASESSDKTIEDLDENKVEDDEISPEIKEV